MKYRPSLVILLTLSLFATATGQTAPPQTQRSEEDEVVRITTNLVQVDAVVTDKKGQPVTNLTREDFEIYEDGEAQKITNLSYVSITDSAAQSPPARTAPSSAPGALAPPVPLRPEQVRRTIALVVDDLGLSFESTAYVRRALKKFVDEQMQPGDLVAIIRTAGGMGVLQQFTSDKQQLYAAIERVRWYPMGRAGVSAFPALEGKEFGANDDAPEILEGSEPRSPNPGQNMEELNEFRRDVFAVGTLGALGYIVRGLRELPGRKSVLLISDGFSIMSRDGNTGRVLEALQRLTDQANRASVVIYTMDARGLQTLGLTAADNTAGLSASDIENRLADRSSELFNTQHGLIYLAQQTGGFNVRNTNDLSGGIKRVLDDQRGYYLIGYRPEESTFDAATGRRKFHKISVKVKRPGLVVRTRTGFYGVTDEARNAAPRTRSQQLIGALSSPFGATGVQLRLTSLFGNAARVGSFVRSLLYIDARDLTFTEQPDGWHQAVMDVMAVTFGDNGQVLDEINKTQTIRVRGKTYERVLKNGLVYFLNVPVKKPGAYQLRIAVRDAAKERVGSATQFIEVPNLGKGRLTLSGLVVNGYEVKTAIKGAPDTTANAATSSSTDAPAQAANNTEGTQEQLDPQAGAAVRRFRQGMIMNFGYVVYNAKVDKTAGPRLETQVRIFRDGKLIFTGTPRPLDTSGQQDMVRLVAGGSIRLGSEMSPGEYVLQVVVTDSLAKDKNRLAAQWIDFEIVK